MSEASTGGFVPPILASNRTEAQGTNVPALSELSERDKPWDQHRADSDVIQGCYSKTQFDDYAKRIGDCSQILNFRLVPDAGEGEYKLKLAAARFCRVRHCQVCAWRRSLMWKAKAYKMLPQVIEDYPTHRFLFVTLTVRNCAIAELRETISWMNKGFKRLTELKSFPAIGWIKTVEVTRGKTPPNSAHPHFHILMMVPSSYFSHGYLSQAKWVELWQKSLRIDYKPVLDVQALKPKDSLTALLAEVIKYQCKPNDLIFSDKDWFLELTRQLHRTRAIAIGGVLREYLRELEQEPEDLIGDDQEGEVDEGHLYFGWKKREKRYKLVDY